MYTDNKRPALRLSSRLLPLLRGLACCKQTPPMHLLVSLFCLCAVASCALAAAANSVQVIIFISGKESPAQLDFLPALQSWAENLSGLPAALQHLPQASSYDSLLSSGKSINSSWFKLEHIIQALKTDDAASLVLALDLSAYSSLSQLPSIQDTLASHPNAQVFLKKSDLLGGFVLQLYKNTAEVQTALKGIWDSGSASGIFHLEFAKFCFWNPSLIRKVVFL